VISIWFMIAAVVLTALLAWRITVRVRRRWQRDLSAQEQLIKSLESRLVEKQNELGREKEQAEASHAEIQKLANARKEFVANVSHELKTPLTSIRGFAETLKNGALDDEEKAARFVGKIEKNADQLQNLIEDLLALSELDSGRYQLELAAVPLAELIAELREDFLESLRSKKHVLELDISNGVQVRAQTAALKQVLTNLLGNAIKYSPEASPIQIRAYPRGNVCEIIVEDKGIGIPLADIPHIFERFYRVDKARSRDLGGTGLGLAIVKHLVNAQGGEIMVTSQPELGSRFIVTLPLVI